MAIGKLVEEHEFKDVERLRIGASLDKIYAAAVAAGFDDAQAREDVAMIISELFNDEASQTLRYQLFMEI